MTNFDFHNLLFPLEFESFCRDLLEIREKNIAFTTYKRGRDGGIDIRATNSKKKIIGQCKLYDPTHYNGLLRNLKKEVAKCKRQSPDRYILCINIQLSPQRSSEIIELFDGFIHQEEDIIDGIKLNKYLSQEPYQHLFKSYSKLLIPNFQSVELALDKVVNRKYYQKTSYFLNEIETKHRLFHYTSQLSELIDQLEDNKVIILSGNPGVGKTTTAMLLANYFLSKKVKDIIFLEERDYADILGIYEEDRLIVVDDFWGDKFSPDIKDHGTFQSEFQRIIGHFLSSKNSYLILTSREYVLRDVLKLAEFETEDLLNTNKYIIKVEDHSGEDKVKILLNHLPFYDFDLSYFHSAQYNDSFERIINHKNYSPRILELFIKNYGTQEHQSSYDFYDSLYKYLENPTSFWSQAFQKLNPTSKAILIVLLVSGDPMDLEDLKASFNDIQIKAREIVNEDIIPGNFYIELKKLEEFYVLSNKDLYFYGTSIEFQSPGIKDYLLEFLRTEGYLWIHPIILKARFFNQLTLVFSTREEKIQANDSDMPLYGQKILLDQDVKSILKQKLINEFDRLSLCNHEEKELTDQLSKYHSKDEIKYWKLIELNHLFPIEFNENSDVRNFVLNNVVSDIRRFDVNGKVVAKRAMIYFPSVIKLLLPYLERSSDDIIRIYQESITFAAEYDYFYQFKEIFPGEFQVFYDRNIQKIRKHIKELISEDIDHYLEIDDGKIGTELDSLLSWQIKELRKQYHFRLSKSYINKLEDTFDINLSNLKNEKKPPRESKKQAEKSKSEKKKYEPRPYAQIIEEYMPEDDKNYSPTVFLNEHGYQHLIRETKKFNSALY